MPRKSTAGTTPPDAEPIDAALTLAAQQGWAGTTMADIAAACGLTLADLQTRFASRAALLDGFARRCDTAMLKATQDEAGQGSVRDRLFAVVMARLDAMAPHKAGLRRIAADLPRSPDQALASACAARRSLDWMLDLAGAQAPWPLGAVHRAALGLVWLDVLRTWFRDDSADLATTMAVLDKRLAGLERLAGRFRGKASAEEAQPA
jgi:ubiquinone biosynthesis protein COQ9